MPSTSEIKAGAAYVELYMRKNRFVRGLRLAERRLKAFGSTASAIGKGMMGIGVATLAPIVGAVKAASNMQETMNKFNVVFGGNSKAIKAWGDTFAGQVGRSKQQVADFLAGTQDLFVPLGFDPTEAEGMSKQLTELAVDLASFNNMADADVMRDLQAALTGSGEVMKKYGVLVSEAAVKQELLNQGIDPKIATNQQKVMARLNIILAGTTAAQGDAIRSAGSFANQMKAARARVNDAAVAIGDALLPVITPLVEKVAEIAKQLGEWAKKNQDTIVGVAKLAAKVVVAGAALVAIGSTLSATGSIIGAVTMAVTGLSVALAFLAANPLVAVAAVVVALGVAMRQATRYTAELSDASERLTAKHDEMRIADQGRLDALKKLSGEEKLNAAQMKEAKSLIGTLTDHYGDLGLAVDEITCKITGLAEAQQRLNKLQREAAVADVKTQMLDLSGQMEEVNKEMASASVGFLAWDKEADMKAAADKAKLLASKMMALRARMKALKAGDVAAVVGGATAGQPTITPEGIGTGPGEAVERMNEELARSLHQLKIDAIADEYQQAIARAKAEYDEKRKLAEKLGADVTAVEENRAQKIANINARFAEQRAAAEQSLDEQIARARINATLKGREKEKALLQLERSEALERAKAQGLDLEKVNRLFDLKERAMVAPSKAISTTRGTFSAFASQLMGRGAGGNAAERAAKATEETAKNTAKMASAWERGDFVAWAAGGG